MTNEKWKMENEPAALNTKPRNHRLVLFRSFKELLVLIFHLSFSIFHLSDGCVQMTDEKWKMENPQR
jgi:hypothetical protein